MRTALLAASVAALTTLAHARAEEDVFDLMVGDPAPPLTVEWIKGEPIGKFLDDHTYVVEFWATWCGPCVRAMPHLSELQKEYADRKVRFVGVNVWEEDQDKVPKWVQAQGDKMAYTVAMDILPEDEEGNPGPGKMATAWMEAAGRDGIPCSFVVQKGKVQWIGHPASLDGPLADVVAGKWDLAKATKEHRAEVGEKAAVMRMQKRLRTALGEKDWKAALATIDEVLAKQPEMTPQLGAQKLFCLAREGRADDVASYAKELEDGVYKKNPQGLNFIARVVTDPENAALGLDPEIGVRVSRKANELTEWKEPILLESHSIALEAAGDHAKAVEMQEKAVQLSAGSKNETHHRARLAELREKKSS